MRFGELYAKTSTVPRNDAILYLTKYAHLLKWRSNEENILDVGCGDGSVTKEVLYPYLEDHVKNIEAVDLSESMIEYAKMNYGMEKIHYRTMDLNSDEDIVTLTTKFDHIFSFYCTHWILDQKSLMERFHKILNPGGQIFITTLADTSIHKTFRKHLDEGTWSKYLPNTSGFTDYSENPTAFMRKLLEDIGFNVELCISEKRCGPFEDFKGFIRSLINVHPFKNYIPKNLQEEYIEDHVRNSCEFSIRLDDSEKYSWPYQSLVFVATKK